MRTISRLILIVFFLISGNLSFAQNVSLYQQFNGRYDFVLVGNTLNNAENNTTTDCVINTSSSAVLNLAIDDNIEKAYLYWAGSGSGDLEIKLNGTAVSSQRQFGLTKLFSPPGTSLNYFSAFADVTTLVQNTGNGTYTVSELDLTQAMIDFPYCANRTNFGGWAMIVIYKNDKLPLNQLNVYDGLQGIPDSIDIMLDNLNVIDNKDARIGFLAWEGDSTLAVNETLRINGNILSNAINPANNAFNSSNTFTSSTALYNMDLDVYNIQNNIKIGDSQALIQLTSGQDFVLINAIVTKLNSQLPDATVSIDNVAKECNSRTITVDYTVYNLNSTEILPANVPITIYANDVPILTTQTLGPIPIGESQSNSAVVTIPDGIPNLFSLLIIVDRDANGLGTVTETNEANNDAVVRVTLIVSPPYNPPANLDSCNEGYSKGTFNFSTYEQSIRIEPTDVVSFFGSHDDAVANTNPITNTFNYTTNQKTTEIFVRIENSDHCVSITSFLLVVKNCPPKIYNLVDTTDTPPNNVFIIENLRNIFLNFQLSIYNRWGALVWTGNHNTADWDGKSTQGTRLQGNDLPEGTYYYVLDLNDPDYPGGMTGYLYLKK